MDTTPVDPTWRASVLPHRASSAEIVAASLWRDGPATVSALVDRTGLHPNTVRTVLRDLRERGLSTSSTEQRPGRGRPRLVYAAAQPDTATETATSADSPTAAVRARLTSLLLDGYAAGADVQSLAVAAGRRLAEVLPGRRTGQSQLSSLTEVLDGLGFGPVVSDLPAPAPARQTTSVELSRCPLLDLARVRPEVVCSMHLGLVRQVLEDVGGPLRADDLVPFAGPLGCTLHLSRHEAA